MAKASQDKVRIDKFLWAMRLFKTRTDAAEACLSGKIRLNNIIAKPSKEVNINDMIHAVLPSGLHKTLIIKEITSFRIGAVLVSNYIEDKTPSEEYERCLLLHKMQSLQRERGTGRPTKKERRDLDKWST